MKDRELCYQSSMSTQTSSSTSSSSSPCHRLALTVTADPVSPPETAHPSPSGRMKVVLRVSLDDVRTMNRPFNLLGICFTPHVRVGQPTSHHVILKAVLSIQGTHSIELDPSDGKLTVIGDLADPWVVAIKLRKLCSYVEIVSVRPARELKRPNPAQLVMV